MKFSENFSAFLKKTEHCSIFFIFIWILFKYEFSLYLIMEKFNCSLEVENKIQCRTRILSNKWFFIYLDNFLSFQW